MADVLTALLGRPLSEEETTVVATLSKTYAGQLCPISAVIGGIVSHEVMKAVSGKFMPCQQWLYYDAVEALPSPLPTEAECAPTGSRYFVPVGT